MANKPINKRVLNRFNDQIIQDFKNVFDENASLENLCTILLKEALYQHKELGIMLLLETTKNMC